MLGATFNLNPTFLIKILALDFFCFSQKFWYRYSLVTFYFFHSLVLRRISYNHWMKKFLVFLVFFLIVYSIKNNAPLYFKTSAQFVAIARRYWNRWIRWNRWIGETIGSFCVNSLTLYFYNKNRCKCFHNFSWGRWCRWSSRSLEGYSGRSW